MDTFSHLETMAALKRYALFRIPTETRGDVWMCISGGMSNMAVVEVDSDRFINAWRREGSGFPEIAYRSIEDWRRDYKFHYAEDGFQGGWPQPVPLALMTAFYSRPIARLEPATTRKSFARWLGLRSHRTNLSSVPLVEPEQCVSFIDGVTRTIWLLVAGAKRFPVSCIVHEAELLHRFVGADGTTPHLVTDLVPQIDHIAKLRENDAFRLKLEAHGYPQWLG